MVPAQKPPANGFVRAARRIYSPLHFERGYNFVLFFIFAGAMLGFSLARFMYLNVAGRFCGRAHAGGAAPGECYYWGGEAGGRYGAGILLHLAAMLPAGVLVVAQFVPVVRHRALLLHRVNGYVVLFLSLASSAGVLMVAERAFGGGLALQAVSGLATLMFLGSLVLAYVNVKRLQIEQHRAWMLRAWFYAGSIITVRIIMFISSVIMSNTGGLYEARPCAVIDYVFFHFRNYTEALYPECRSWYTGENPDQHAVVRGDLGGDPMQAGTVLGASFGMAFWLALAIHAVGVEAYLRLTPRESERLRNISYQRQMEAGMKQPGNAGLTAEKLGDASPWVPEGTHGQHVPQPAQQGEHSQHMSQPAWQGN